MKVMMGVMMESKNDYDDDYFCGAAAGGAVGIYPATPGFQYKMGQLQSIKLDSPPPKTRSIFPQFLIWITLIVSFSMNIL
jgi:hypothetical protein